MFSKCKMEFDKKYMGKDLFEESLVPVHTSFKKNIKIKNVNNEPNEEYYKWQFIYSLIYSGLYNKEYIGTEVRFPKGNKNSAPLIIDAVIFDSKEWLEHYKNYCNSKNNDDLEWLNNHIIAVIEFKKGDKEISKVYTGQIKGAMKEKDPANAYVFSMYYDSGRLFLFHRRDGLYLRYDESKNAKGDKSTSSDLSLNIPDPYIAIPSFDDIIKRLNYSKKTDRSMRKVYDLEIIPSIQTIQVQEALSKVLRAFDRLNLVNQRGYEILIQTFALKIFDEKRNHRISHETLRFYYNEENEVITSLADDFIQEFIERLQNILEEAESEYKAILGHVSIDWQNINHIQAVVAICKAFQDFSFILSSKSNLYQLVFYNFANSFKRDESAQFLTPLQIIDFMTKIINPRSGDTVFDPCCGIGDFLSMSYVHSLEKESSWRLDDGNIYGVDLDEYMIMLTRLNMLLNGDGEAKLFYTPDKGSILYKIVNSNPPQVMPLIPSLHKKGNWDNWPDKTKLKKFDVILTNPPFGEDRAYRVESKKDEEIIEMYETWELARGNNSIDLGIIFLENAYRVLKEGGRLGIVLSNSIASTNKWNEVRKWLIERMRIVAIFDLPANVFAETGVNTSIIFAYKPSKKKIDELNKNGYSVFARDIKNVGYEKRTSKRNVYFNPLFKIDPISFEIDTNEAGEPILNEDFTNIIDEFKYWSKGQEEEIAELFLKESVEND